MIAVDHGRVASVTRRRTTPLSFQPAPRKAQRPGLLAAEASADRECPVLQRHWSHPAPRASLLFIPPAPPRPPSPPRAIHQGASVTWPVGSKGSPPSRHPRRATQVAAIDPTRSRKRWTAVAIWSVRQRSRARRQRTATGACDVRAYSAPLAGERSWCPRRTPRRCRARPRTR